MGSTGWHTVSLPLKCREIACPSSGIYSENGLKTHRGDRKMIWIVLLLSSSLSFADDPGASVKCLELEGMKLGCVPAPVHACYMNKNAAQKGTPCNYGGGFGSQYEAESGAIQYHC